MFGNLLRCGTFFGPHKASVQSCGLNQSCFLLVSIWQILSAGCQTSTVIVAELNTALLVPHKLQLGAGFLGAPTKRVSLCAMVLLNQHIHDSYEEGPQLLMPFQYVCKSVVFVPLMSSVLEPKIDLTVSCGVGWILWARACRRNLGIKDAAIGEAKPTRSVAYGDGVTASHSLSMPQFQRDSPAVRYRVQVSLKQNVPTARRPNEHKYS